MGEKSSKYFYLEQDPVESQLRHRGFVSSALKTKGLQGKFILLGFLCIILFISFLLFNFKFAHVFLWFAIVFFILSGIFLLFAVFKRSFNRRVVNIDSKKLRTLENSMVRNK
jgi:pilus assembly protein TadC